jgi:hypothetical protein
MWLVRRLAHEASAAAAPAKGEAVAAAVAAAVVEPAAVGEVEVQQAATSRCPAPTCDQQPLMLKLLMS